MILILYSLFKYPVTVLHEGSVLAQGKMKDLKKDSAVIEVYLGR